MYSKKPLVTYSLPYHGKRDSSFTDMIRNVLLLGLSAKKIDLLLNLDGIRMFSTAFTHKSVNDNDNYEFWETLGDSTLNKCVLWYISRRFPQINCPAGSDLLTRLKIKIIKSDSFSNIADSIGFWPFVSVDQTLRVNEKQSILEDVCEAFFGVLEFLIDKHIGLGYGYSVCYTILSELLDRRKIVLSYNEIVDFKTQVKEVFDAFKNIIGTIKYINRPDTTNSSKVYVLVQQALPSGMTSKLAESIGNRLDETEQDAAKKALENLRSQGYSKNVPPEYLMFCT